MTAMANMGFRWTDLILVLVAALLLWLPTELLFRRRK
jgi:hypothetical protein